MKRTREEFEKIAEEHGVELSSVADSIIEAVNHKDGNCPCRINPEVACPCPMGMAEVEKDGKCTCFLFVKKEKKEEK
jgi:ferredoxin-thioredoxin reductase catalytic subunit